MVEQRVRVMVGEGRPARKGLLRFVLENEGHTVVSEATSTLQLAQQLVMHRPDIVVLDDGIDVSAVGMIREVLPSARVILVWPRGVSAVGADARLEPSEVMTGLGPAIDRVMGTGPLIAPSRPREPAPDVIVVPEPGPPEPTVSGPPPTTAPAARAGAEAPAAPAAPAHGTVETTEEPTPPSDAGTPVTSVTAPAEAISGVMLEPSGLAPDWTYTAHAAARGRRRRLFLSVAALAALGAIVAVGAIVLSDRTVAIQQVSGSIGDFVLPQPGAGGQPAGTTNQPGTYEGLVRVRASGRIRLSATGDLRLRLNGSARIVAEGNVRVGGRGVVKNVTAGRVRVRGKGIIRLVMEQGWVRLRLQGSLVAHGEGTVRVGGAGRFLIRHRPL